MDLTRAEPRPMDATLDGYAWLPRMIDKSRAFRAGTLGDYIHPCPVDRRTLRLLGIHVATFGDIVERSATDEEVLAGLRAHGIPTAEEAWFDPVAFEEELQRGVAQPSCSVPRGPRPAA